MKLLERSAALGSKRAHLALGEIYLKAEENYISNALSHYEKAGELGDSEAYKRIAELYHNGKVLKKDIGKALHYYDLSANL